MKMNTFSRPPLRWDYAVESKRKKKEELRMSTDQHQKECCQSLVYAIDIAELVDSMTESYLAVNVFVEWCPECKKIHNSGISQV